MVRVTSNLVPWCRFLGRQLDSSVRGGRSSSSVSINAANLVVVDGQACRCVSSSAGLLDGTGGRQRDIGIGNTGRFSTVADVTDVGSKLPDNEVSFGASSPLDEALAGEMAKNFGKPSFSAPKPSDKSLFGTDGTGDSNSSSSVPKEVSFSVDSDDKVPSGRGPYFPASQFPETPQPMLRNDRYFRSRNNSTVAKMLKLLEETANQEEVEKILDAQIPDVTMSSRWPWMPLLDALQRGPKPYLALVVFNWKKDKLVGGDPREYAKMISTAGRLNQLDVATNLFKDMEAKGVQRSAITCNALISAYSKNDQASKALEIFEQMLDGEDCRPTLVTYNTLISMYSKLSVLQMENVFELCKSSGFDPNVVTFNSMIWGYMRGKEFVKMEEMYEQMKRSGCKPDPITFSGLIIGYSKANQIEKMELAFSHMQEEGFPMSTMIAEILTEFYAVDRRFEKMERIMKITANTPGASCSSRIFGFAIQAYAETRWIPEMEATMEKMFASKRLFTSSKTLEAVITAYGSRSIFDNLDALLQRIKALGWSFQHSTYHTLLYEYGKGRELEKMEAVFREMENAMDLAPTEGTYNLLADSYRAAGDEVGFKMTIDRMSAAGFKTKEVLDTEPDHMWTDDQIFGGRRR